MIASKSDVAAADGEQTGDVDERFGAKIGMGGGEILQPGV